MFSDTISAKLQQWSRTAPNWTVAQHCRTRVDRFLERTAGFQKRLAAPLVVAMLGGTGTGKSTLLNALLGEKVVKEGRERPTTNKTTLVCHQYINPADWSIDTTGIDIVKRNLPALEQMMVLDCPDPDTTENAEERESNLTQLRRVLPLCDVLLVTATQQKYRSKKVLDELAGVAPGAHLIFVQTHADRDTDIRDDWRQLLKNDYETGLIFFVDSLNHEQNSVNPALPNDFNDLKNLLTKELSGETALKIRQANYAGLAEQTVEDCKQDIADQWEKIDILRKKITGERRKFGRQLAGKMQDEVIRDRRIWESQLIGRVTAQWGYSPFSLVLRLYQGLGAITSTLLLARGFASPSRLALWGAFEGVRSLKKISTNKKILNTAGTGTAILSAQDENLLRTSSIALTGFAAEASLPPKCCETEYVLAESKQVADGFVAELSKELDRICSVLTARNNRWMERCFYEILFTGMCLFVLFRPAKNFFWDSIRNPAVEIFGIGQYFSCLFWLLVWVALLLGLFTWMLRRGLEREIKDSAVRWETLPCLELLFGGIERETNAVLNFRSDLELIRQELELIEQQAEKLTQQLGRKKFVQ
ncbi:MAG: GTPase domain-containing protein [Planctomycetaceae bacterium]|jgi:GTPase SAR1 family protein|nr:GTPase domain-containing protein [Planctomycetaceae bacterium]